MRLGKLLGVIWEGNRCMKVLLVMELKSCTGLTAGQLWYMLPVALKQGLLKNFR